MQLIGKIPIGIEEIAKMMKLSPDEVRVWPHLPELRSYFKDYNFGVLKSEDLVKQLDGMIAKCEKDNTFSYATGVANVTSIIKRVY